MMKTKLIYNVLAPFLVCLLIAISVYPNTVLDLEKYSTEGLELDFNTVQDIAMADIEDEPLHNEYVFTPFLGKSFQGFKEALAFKESQGDYFIVNTFGYLGKYQFGTETLKMIGIHNPNYFLNTPALQEKAFIAYSKRNKWILRKDIKRYVGKTINGVKITESGILAAAHLAGAGSVKKFLRSGGEQTFADGYGSTLTYYMKRFSGYNTSFIKADNKAKVQI